MSAFPRCGLQEKHTKDIDEIIVKEVFFYKDEIITCGQSMSSDRADMVSD